MMSCHMRLRFLHFGWPNTIEEHFVPYNRVRDKLYIENGCVMWRNRVSIPLVFQHPLLQELHSVHQGESKMRSVVQFFFW